MRFSSSYNKTLLKMYLSNTDFTMDVMVSNAHNTYKHTWHSTRNDSYWYRIKTCCNQNTNEWTFQHKRNTTTALQVYIKVTKFYAYQVQVWLCGNCTEVCQAGWLAITTISVKLLLLSFSFIKGMYWFQVYHHSTFTSYTDTCQQHGHPMPVRINGPNPILYSYTMTEILG